MNPEQPYIVSPNVTFTLGDSGSLTAQRSFSERSYDLDAEALSLLLEFGRGRSPDQAFRRLSRGRGIDREEFDRLLSTLDEHRLLIPAVENGFGDEPLRLRRFREAIEQRLERGAWARFPLLSPFDEQQPAIYYPGLETRAIHDRERFAWLDLFDDRFDSVVAELDALLERRRGFAGVFHEHTARGEWAACAFWKHGVVHDWALEACPETAELLRSVPGTELGTALFSALAPGTRLVPHCGMTNARLRAYLPLRVPEGCGFEIAGRRVHLQEGRAFVFDDSFVHTAWNEGSSPRFVLFFDFLHPDLTPLEARAFNEFYRSILGPSPTVTEPEEAPESPDWILG